MTAGAAYAAGDAAAARQIPLEEHLRSCRGLLERPAMISGLFRRAIQRGYAGHLAWLVPGRWMYRLTRVAVRR